MRTWHRRRVSHHRGALAIIRRVTLQRLQRRALNLKRFCRCPRIVGRHHPPKRSRFNAIRCSGSRRWLVTGRPRGNNSVVKQCCCHLEFRQGADDASRHNNKSFICLCSGIQPFRNFMKLGLWRDHDKLLKTKIDIRSIRCNSQRYA
jgi:hypothetical protein